MFQLEKDKEYIKKLEHLASESSCIMSWFAHEYLRPNNGKFDESDYIDGDQYIAYTTMMKLAKKLDYLIYEYNKDVG